ncbi:MAG TPA: hypothetical protein VNH21_13585 [Steroidobacteraceae bacterium]|nr:hypothetical protein [Steroidobacteraceae bacterium]
MTPAYCCICEVPTNRPGLCQYCRSFPVLVAAWAEGQARIADPERKPERPT